MTAQERRRNKAAAALSLLALLSMAAPRASADLNCVFVVQNIVFGTYDPTAVLPHDLLTDVKVDCTNIQGNNGQGQGQIENAFMTVTASAGQGNNNSFFPRKMTGPTQKLEYNIFTNSGMTTVFGTGGASGTTSFSGNISVNNNTTNRYTRSLWARIPAGQDVLPGDYNDSITFTVTF